MAEYIDAVRLKRGTEALGLEINDALIQYLDIYAQLLVEWNEKVNLTSLTAPEDIEVKHFLDSMMLAAQPEIMGRVVDVGSGAGFPGVILKLYKPQIELTIMEPNGKRQVFLRELCDRLGLEVELVKERAEEAARKVWRQCFDVATARAVAPMRVLGEYCLPLVRCGGCFIAMKAEATNELEVARDGLAKLGGDVARVEAYRLSGGAQRTLIVVEKKRDTPVIYPRAGGVIKKRPL